MKDECRLSGVMRGVSPCTNCGERHTACHDKCPKDDRGEYGYRAWKAETIKINDNRRAYIEDKHNAYEAERRRQKWGKMRT